MSNSKKKKQCKRSSKQVIVIILLAYGIIAQFVIVGLMSRVGNRVVLDTYIPSKELIVDASIMIGIMLSVLLLGMIRRSLVRIFKLNPIDIKLIEQYCIIMISLLTMLLIEWVIFGVNFMLIPVWILLRKITTWQQQLEEKKKEQQNQLIKTYMKEHIEQLPAMHLCNLDHLEKKRFLIVLQQNKQSLGSRVLNGMIALGQRLANGFMFLVMGSLLCLLIYVGEISIAEGLLYLFSLNSFMSAMNVWTQITRKKARFV